MGDLHNQSKQNSEMGRALVSDQRIGSPDLGTQMDGEGWWEDLPWLRDASAGSCLSVSIGQGRSIPDPAWSILGIQGSEGLELSADPASLCIQLSLAPQCPEAVFSSLCVPSHLCLPGAGMTEYMLGIQIPGCAVVPI